MLRHTSLCDEQSQVIDNIGKQAIAEHLRCVRAFGPQHFTSAALFGLQLQQLSFQPLSVGRGCCRPHGAALTWHKLTT